MGWLGAVGGVELLLLNIFSFFFGGYAQFNCVISSLLAKLGGGDDEADNNRNVEN